jgi:hypothetical protein
MDDVLMAALLLIGATTVALYWIAWFRGGSDVQVSEDEAYLKFEKAFPVADAWLAVCMLVAAIGLLAGESYAYPFMLLAGSAGIFLGLMDVTYAVENGLYGLARTSAGMRIEAAMHVITLGVSALVIVYAMSRLM